MATVWDYTMWGLSYPWSGVCWSVNILKASTIYSLQTVASTPGKFSYLFWNAGPAITYVAAEAPQAAVNAATYSFNKSVSGLWTVYDGVMYYPRYSYYSWADIAPGQYGKSFIWGLTNGTVWSIMLWWYTGVLESHFIDWDIE